MDRFRKDCILHQGKTIPTQFIIADAKRGDIGNTSAMYARTFFEELDIDSVTVAPYMGEDSVTPFLSYEGKWVIPASAYQQQGFPRLPADRGHQRRTPFRKSIAQITRMGQR